MPLFRSIRMQNLLKTRLSAAFDCASHTIHMCEDYGPAEVEETARKMFELGEAARTASKNMYFAEVDADEVAPSSVLYVYLMATSEEDACAQVATWDEGGSLPV